MRTKIKQMFSQYSLRYTQEVKALDMVIKLHKQEDKIFWKTLNMKGQYEQKINILDRVLYDFQMLVEVLQRFGSKEKIDILGEAQHELMLSYRFMLTGHYNSAGKHLRSYMEHIVDYLYEGKSNYRNKKIEEIVKKSTYKQDELLKLDDQQVYIFYSYLSNIYTHHSDPFEELILDKNKLREVRDLIVAIMFISSRLLFGIHGKMIEDHYGKTILNPVKYEKSVYGSYIQALLSTTWFYNTMMEGGLYKKLKDRHGNSVDMTLRVDKEYHEEVKNYFE